MHETVKNVQVKMDGEQKQFRISKLDAFSGARLLRMIAMLADDHKDAKDGQSKDTLWDMLFSLNDKDMELVMKTCLSKAEVSLPAGYIRVWNDGCWGLPEFEYDTMMCITLTLEVMAFTLNGFFPGGGLSSRPAQEHTSL